MRLVGGGHDDVLPGAQAEALGHLAQVDVGLASGLGRVCQEEVLLHVLLVAVHLPGVTGFGTEVQWFTKDMFHERLNVSNMNKPCG